MRYQQGTERIEIIVRKDSGGGGLDMSGVKEQTGATRTRKQTWRTAVYGSESLTRSRRIIKTNATHLLSASLQIGRQAVNYYIGGLGMTNGDEALQQQAQRTAEIVTDCTNFASATAMGAIYGAWGGPIGMVFGATLGALQSATSIGFKYLGRRREFTYKEFKLNNAIEYRRARASINLTTGRLR